MTRPLGDTLDQPDVRTASAPSRRRSRCGRTPMSRWEKRRHPLPENHSWKAAEGYNIFVADRGALRLDFPDGWIVKPDRASICFHDREPPDDRCCMEVSYLRLQPIDWSGLPVPELLKSVCHGEGRTGCGEIVQAMRPDLELAWTEYSTLDPAEQRPATHRVCVARSANVVLPRP